MPEKEVWQAVKRDWPSGGRIIRVEEKSRAGFVDVLACYQGVTWFVELKHAPIPLDMRKLRRALAGLKGPQAVELHRWWAAGAPAYLVVGWGVQGVSGFVIYEGRRLIDVYEWAQKRGNNDESPPQPFIVMEEAFSWRRLFQGHERLTSGCFVE